jgi:glutathione S-transferase
VFQADIFQRVTRKGAVTLGLALLAAALYFFPATHVAAAYDKFAVSAPGNDGHPDFERIYCAHINTREWILTFLMPLWPLYFSDAVATALGLAWIAGRAFYLPGYAKAVERRLPGQTIGRVLFAVLKCSRQCSQTLEGLSSV